MLLVLEATAPRWTVDQPQPHTVRPGVSWHACGRANDYSTHWVSSAQHAQTDAPARAWLLVCYMYAIFTRHERSSARWLVRRPVTSSLTHPGAILSAARGFPSHV